MSNYDTLTALRQLVAECSSNPEIAQRVAEYIKSNNLDSNPPVAIRTTVSINSANLHKLKDKLNNATDSTQLQVVVSSTLSATEAAKALSVIEKAGWSVIDTDAADKDLVFFKRK